MKFVHIADVHFDVPFTTLEGRNLAEKRRLEQRDAFRRVIEYIKENNIPYLFICGDLYEQEYVRESTIEYINKLFETILDTKIYIVPGNHDPLLKNSYYTTYNWAKNVKIFKEKIEKIEEKDICIYGYGFEDFYLKNPEYEKIKIENTNKINILLTHGTLDGNKNDDSVLYNPISKTVLKNIGFDYVGIGHIHKISFNDEENQNIINPGSLISLGFDEPGVHRNDSTEKLMRILKIKIYSLLKLIKKNFLKKKSIYQKLHLKKS